MSEKAKKIAAILKARFPGLTVEETLDLVFKILDVFEAGEYHPIVR